MEVGTYDFATRYEVHFAPLPAFRHLEAEEYQDNVAKLIREIEEEGRQARGDNPVAGVEKILSQDPFEPPTRQPSHSPRPLFRAERPEVWKDLMGESNAHDSQYQTASDALRSGNLEAAEWFPEGSFRPALAFVGSPRPGKAAAAPTRTITVLESGEVERGEIPVVKVPARMWWSPPREEKIGQAVEPRARGQPP